MGDRVFLRRVVLVLVVLSGCGGEGASSAPPGGECRKDSDCDDGVDCTRDICAPTVGGALLCQHEPRDEACAPGERCVVGVPDLAGCRPDAVVACVGKRDGAICEVSDPCRAGPGTCRAGRCESEAKTCPDRACRTSLGCDPATGECRYESLADDTVCVFAADPCRPARCRAGECEPTAGPLCDDGDSCTQDICNVNVCEHKTLADGTPCDDGDPCTQGEACQAGTCGGGAPRDCDDHNDCTTDTCDPAKGGCVSTAIADDGACLAGGNHCRPGTCLAGTCQDVKDLSCDDQDPCTKDSCDPSSGCRHEATSNGSCNDGNACTANDMCNAGQCVPGTPVVCDDDDPCTTDSCDPGQGCVFVPFAPCCGNSVVENGGDHEEQCDAGPLGSAGCGTDCRVRVVNLTKPPAGGRFPAVAWSVPEGSGLVAYEAATGTGLRALVTRKVGSDLSVAPERLVWDYKDTAVHDVTLLAASEGPAGSQPAYFAAVSRPVSVDLFALDREGGLLDQEIEAWTMWAVDVQAGRVRAGSLGSGRVLVAWQDAAYCSGSSGVPVVRVGEADLAQGTVEPAVQEGSGSCDPWSPALLGDVCAGADGGVFTLAERETGVPGVGSVVRHKVLPWDPKGVGSPVVLTEYQGDAGAAFPAACAAAPDGQSFLLVYWEIDTDLGVLRVRSAVIGRDGGMIGQPGILQEISVSGGSTSSLCFTNTSAVAGLEDGRFLLVCAMFRMTTSGEFVASSLEWRLIDSDGKPVGDFAPLGFEDQPVALDARATLGPRGDVLVAWYENATIDDGSGKWMALPGWLRLFAVGKGLVW